MYRQDAVDFWGSTIAVIPCLVWIPGLSVFYSKSKHFINMSKLLMLLAIPAVVSNMAEIKNAILSREDGLFHVVSLLKMR